MDKYNKESFNVGTPSEENIKYAFNKLIYYLEASSVLDDYKSYKNKFDKLLTEAKKIYSVYDKRKKLSCIEDKKLQSIKFDLIDLADETRLMKSYYAEWSLQWIEAIISLRISEKKAEVNNG